MPDGCLLVFDPIISTPAMFQAWGIACGTLLFQSRNCIELKGALRRLVGQPIRDPFTGDIRLIVRNCGPGSLPPIPVKPSRDIWGPNLDGNDAQGDVVFLSAPTCFAGDYIVPCWFDTYAPCTIVSLSGVTRELAQLINHPLDSYYDTPQRFYLNSWGIPTGTNQIWIRWLRIQAPPQNQQSAVGGFLMKILRYPPPTSLHFITSFVCGNIGLQPNSPPVAWFVPPVQTYGIYNILELAYNQLDLTPLFAKGGFFNDPNLLGTILFSDPHQPFTFEFALPCIAVPGADPPTELIQGSWYYGSTTTVGYEAPENCG